MRKIPLSQGQLALVDDEDFEYLNQFRWCYKSGAGYAVRNTYERGGHKPRMVYMHREIMQPGGNPMRVVVDHINRDRLDNRRENLRVVDRLSNLKNSDYWERRVSA